MSCVRLGDVGCPNTNSHVDVRATEGGYNTTTCHYPVKSSHVVQGRSRAARWAASCGYAVSTSSFGAIVLLASLRTLQM